jgi:tRNA(fMet)-specific endonuclease VapC
MLVLDTDTLTHLLLGHKRVTEKRAQTSDEVVLTVITRIEVLQGRFAALLKAEDGEKLLLAQQRLLDNEMDLEKFIVLAVDSAASAESTG